MKTKKTKKKKVSISKKIGLPPGSITYIGKERSDNATIELIRFTPSDLIRSSFEDCQKLKQQVALDSVNWVNVDGIHNQELINEFEADFGLSNLQLEDIANTSQRPKVEITNNNIFLTLRMLSYINNNIDSEQISIVLKDNLVISFQEKSGDIFGAIRDRIENSKGQIRIKKADYLFYSLLDTVIDNYFLVIEHVGNNLEILEDEIFNNPTHSLLEEIHNNKNELLTLRRAIYPLRESVVKLLREENTLIQSETMHYLNDVYDHIIQIIDILESYKDIISSLKDSYMSSLSLKMNQVMQVLTIIATIFIPLTFLAGIYGMNFENIPELHWKNGYLYFWLVSLGLVIALILYFKRKKWL